MLSIWFVKIVNNGGIIPLKELLKNEIAKGFKSNSFLKIHAMRVDGCIVVIEDMIENSLVSAVVLYNFCLQ